MSTIKANKLEHISTANGGIQLDNAGHVTVDGQQLPTAGPLSNRNRVINGGMLIKQRDNRAATGFSTAFYAGPDRWLVNRSGTGNTGFSQIANTDFGGTKAAQATFLAAASETFVISQRIESSNIADLAGQTVTLSFYASGSSDAGSATLDASLSYASAVDNFSTETVIATNSVSYTALSQKFTFTFTLPSGAANGVAVRLSGAKTTATGTFTLTFGGVQLEAGEKATPFEHRSYGDELHRCKRYFEKRSFDTNNWEPICVGTVPGTSTSTTLKGIVYYEVVKRVAPTITSSAAGTFRRNGAGIADAQATGLTINQISDMAHQLEVTQNNQTSGYSGWISRQDASTTFINYDSEL